jgi:hypothetical protein
MHLFRPSIDACHIEATPETKQQKTLGSVPVPLLSSFHKSIFTSKGFDLNFCAPLADKKTCSCNPSWDGRIMSIGSKDQTLLIWYSDLLACRRHQYKFCQSGGKMLLTLAKGSLH